MSKRKVIVVDFETRSKADIRLGTHEYACHESTEILCLSWANKDDDDHPTTWGHRPVLVETRTEKIRVNTKDGSEKYRTVKIPVYEFEEFNRDKLEELFEEIKNGAVLSAHHAAFENKIWNEVGVKKYGFPKLDNIEDGTGQWECTAARAAANGLPRSLEDVGKALGLSVEKDTEGARVMLQLAKPRKPSSSNPSEWYNDPERFDVLFAYCEKDVIVERLVDRVVPSLDQVGPIEQRLFELDAKINNKGFRVDRDTCKIISDLLTEGKFRASRKVEELTEGAVTSVSQTADLKRWINAQGVETNSVSKAAIDSLLLTDLPEKVREVLELRISAGKSSVAKYEKLLSMTQTDGRLRNVLLYFGANTGRWAGKGVQLQNLPRGSVGDVEQLIEDIVSLSYDELEEKYGSVFEACSSAIRPVLIADEGYDLLFSDYAAIEARVLPWLARDEVTLELFRKNVDLYIDMAAVIYNIKPEDVTKEQRQVGKTAILGLGYGMGVDTFIDNLRALHLDMSDESAMIEIIIKENERREAFNADPKNEDKQKPLLQYDTKAALEYNYIVALANISVAAYRKKYNKIVTFWYDCEKAAIAAFKQPGKTTHAGRIRFWRRTAKSALYMVLPSGRRICFFNPKIEDTETPWGTKKKQLSYMKLMSAYGMKYMRGRTYGGDLAQTATQATARDCMGESMLHLDSIGFTLHCTVHDEIITSAPEGKFSAEYLEKEMSRSCFVGRGFTNQIRGSNCKEISQVMNIEDVQYIDGFNYACCYFKGDFNTNPSSGGLDPYTERFTTLEQVSDDTGIPIETLVGNINWDTKTITDEGKLIKSSVRFGEWRFELTLRNTK